MNKITFLGLLPLSLLLSSLTAYAAQQIPSQQEIDKSCDDNFTYLMGLRFYEGAPNDYSKVGNYITRKCGNRYETLSISFDVIDEESCERPSSEDLKLALLERYNSSIQRPLNCAAFVFKTSKIRLMRSETHEPDSIGRLTGRSSYSCGVYSMTATVTYACKHAIMYK
ncbi:MAG: hypothetical protein NDJ89_10500 [Oligoflexia bacterium]|nr:hypothetical protein [Oligoflexia bacterium]